MKTRSRTIIISILCASLAFISGCSTVQGMGKDISKGGKEIQRAAS